MAETDNKIERAAKQGSLDIFGYIEGDYTIPYRHGAKWAIKYCDQVIREVLEKYKCPIIADGIIMDFEEKILSETNFSPLRDLADE